MPCLIPQYHRMVIPLDRIALIRPLIVLTLELPFQQILLVVHGKFILFLYGLLLRVVQVCKPKSIVVVLACLDHGQVSRLWECEQQLTVRGLA